MTRVIRCFLTRDSNNRSTSWIPCRSKTSQGFIEKQDTRPSGNASGDGDALGLAEGDPVGGGVFPSGEAKTR
uniref:Uncharacterized protein n=1 Tax=Candidatus Kentrum sp. SD TaxID=2126332 RepID=A0A451BRS1_9GAMM|nr:MAG: hypothetical protein BECKSD772D_GA0070982_11816 [Candidatus Kentron sp. SD]